MTQTSVTNGGLIVEPGAPGTIIISAINLDMAVSILETELPWLINALGEFHRELTADEQRAHDAAALEQWDALASMMAG